MWFHDTAIFHMIYLAYSFHDLVRICRYYKQIIYIDKYIFIIFETILFNGRNGISGAEVQHVRQADGNSYLHLLVHYSAMMQLLYVNVEHALSSFHL